MLNTMAEEQKTATTFLLLDIGERLTTALLIKQVAGSCRLASRAYVDSTHKLPVSNASKGVFDVIEKLENASDYKLLSNDNELILHTRQLGRGIDQIFISISMGGLLSTVIVAPTIEDPAVESAVHLLQRFPSKLDKLFTGDSLKNSVQEIEWMAQNKPDLILFVGNDSRGRGMQNHMLKAAQMIGTAVRQFSGTNQPEIIYAAADKWVEKVQALLNIGSQLKVTSNLRPDLKNEHVLPTRLLLEDLLRRTYLARIPGLPEVIRWSGEMPFSRNEGLAVFARYQAALADGPVLILDLDSQGLTLVYAKPKFVDLVVRPDLGLGESLSSLETKLDIQELSEWLLGYDDPADAAETLRTHFINRSIFPNTIPQTKNELELDQVMIQGIIRQAVKDASSTWEIEPDQLISLNRLFVRGDLLTAVGDHEGLILTLFNALQIQNECECFIDSHNAMALLGQLLEYHTIAAVDVIESNVFQYLGWLIGAPGRGKKGNSALTVALKELESDTNILEETINWGNLHSIPILNANICDATLKYKGQGLSIGLGNTKKLDGIEGLAAHLWIDTRGRPFTLPDDKINEWTPLSSS